MKKFIFHLNILKCDDKKMKCMIFIFCYFLKLVLFIKKKTIFIVLHISVFSNYCFSFIFKKKYFCGMSVAIKTLLQPTTNLKHYLLKLFICFNSIAFKRILNFHLATTYQRYIRNGNNTTIHGINAINFILYIIHKIIHKLKYSFSGSVLSGKKSTT